MGGHKFHTNWRRKETYNFSQDHILKSCPSKWIKITHCITSMLHSNAMSNSKNLPHWHKWKMHWNGITCYITISQLGHFSNTDFLVCEESKSNLRPQSVWKYTMQLPACCALGLVCEMTFNIVCTMWFMNRFGQ